MLVYSNLTDDGILFVAVAVGVLCCFFNLHSLLLLNDERKKKQANLLLSMYANNNSSYKHTWSIFVRE
jgi:hypothetical protein